MDTERLTPEHEEYPAALTALLGTDAPEALACAGPRAVLRQRSLALFCSARCPGAMILQTYDMMQKLRHRPLTVIGGFHSPMERECLRTLARGTASVVWCLAKDAARFRLPGEFTDLFDAQRVLVLSAFDARAPRITRATAEYRNRVAAAIADEIFLSYAAPGGHTEAFCAALLAWDKPVYTLDAPENQAIIERGAVPVPLKDIDTHWPAAEFEAIEAPDALV